MFLMHMQELLHVCTLEGVDPELRFFLGVDSCICFFFFLYSRTLGSSTSPPLRFSFFFIRSFFSSSSLLRLVVGVGVLLSSELGVTALGSLLSLKLNFLLLVDGKSPSESLKRLEIIFLRSFFGLCTFFCLGLLLSRNLLELSSFLYRSIVDKLLFENIIIKI